MTNHAIRMKMHLSDQDIESIEALHETCSAVQPCNLKLELDFKRAAGVSTVCSLREINEFFYEVDGVAVSYLGLCHFGGHAAELNGMTHPEWRGMGFFTRLLELAAYECRRRGFRKILLLTDEKSATGKAFIKSAGAVHDSSEYRMKLENPVPAANPRRISLREAIESDRTAVAGMNAVFFGDPVPDEAALSVEPPDVPGEVTFMICGHSSLKFSEYGVSSQPCRDGFQAPAIGKIRVHFNGNHAFISGFGLLPEYRGQGLGRAALTETLHLIRSRGMPDVELDVSCTNETALSLYIQCGFVVKSVMEYHRLA
jgi:ribosomal protein S18 acetylase RimI-like enzyme